MSGQEQFVSEVFHLGGMVITTTVVTSWAIMVLIVAAAWLLTRRLEATPRAAQVVVEGVVTAIENAIRAVLPDRASQLVPFIGTLWIFILVANLASLVPGVSSPTSDLSLTAALALLVFFAVHWFGIRAHGLRRYLRHYLQPNPVLLPFHLVSELSRTVALAVRLFGNMFSLQMAALLVLLVAGFLAPVPVLMLHIVEALVQAYIFGMLALVYVAGAIQSQESADDTDKRSET